jgi:tetratricopeptide (TPR) repeat protein
MDMAPLDVSLVVSDTTVTLIGAGPDVSAPHGGVRPGLQGAVHDVLLERARHGGAVRDVEPHGEGSPGLVSLRRAGRLLAESFLPEPVASALRELLQRANASTVALRIGLDAPGFAALPWEALPDPVTGEPLALHPLVVLYRRHGGVGVPARWAGPLRIVVAIASPDEGGGPLLDYEHELRSVIAAVRPARRSRARVEVVPFATTRAIRDALDVPGGVHVLHISAHGRPGVLVLEDDDGRAREVTAEELVAEAIPPDRMPPVLALAACYTDVDGERQGTSFAARVAARGACAVIGTQTSVTDRYATLLFAEVYARLAASRDTDVVAAVSEARRIVQRDLVAGGNQQLAGMDEWGVVTVLANAARLPVVDHDRPPVPAPAPRTAEWGRVAARPVGQFVGRRGLQRRLPAVLDEHPGLVLHGIGGVGKTTLAAEILRRTVQADPTWRVASLYGQLTVDAILLATAAAARRELLVRSDSAPEATAAVQAATRMDLPWADRLALLHDHVLDEVPLLLVLDNFEDNLADGAITDPALSDLLAAWAAAPARSRLLITSRHPVTVPGLFAVPVGPLSAAETSKLLWSLPNLDRHATDLATAEQIWRVVGGHPRSLEYLDALLGQGQARFEDITDRLTNAVTTRLGPAKSATWLAEDRTLEAALGAAVTLAADDVLLADHLARLEPVPGAVDLLVAISVFREPVPVDAVPASAELLTLLAGSSLVYHDQDLVFMHRWTATELHRRLPPPRTAHRAAAAYWQQRDTSLHDWIEARHHLLAAGDLEAAAAVTGRVSSELNHAGAWDQAIAFIHDTLRWLPPGSPLRPAYFGQLGNLTYNRGDYAEAERRYRQALAAFEDLGSRDGVARTHHGLGMVAQSTGDYRTAEHEYRRALTVLEELGDRAGAGNLLFQLGTLAYLRGSYDEAEELCRRSLAVAEELGRWPHIATTYHQLGILAASRDDLETGERHTRMSLDIAERLGNQPIIAAAYHQLGIFARKQGDHDTAERHQRRALAIAEQIGDQSGVAHTYLQLAMLAGDRGDRGESERRFAQALNIFEQAGDQANLASTLTQLAVVLTEDGRAAEAVAVAIGALAIRLALDVPQAAVNLHQLAELRAELGDAFGDVAAHSLDPESYANLMALIGERERRGGAAIASGASEA